VKRLLAAALFFLAAAAPAIAADVDLSVTAFRDRMAVAMRGATGNAVETVDDRTLKTKKADGTELTVSIDNAYVEYQADHSRLDAIIAKYARILSASTDKLEDAASQLVVIVRPSDYIKRSLPPGAKLDSILPPRPMAGDLAFFLAVDSPEMIRTATRDDLSRWKLDEAAAWTQALANIHQHVGPLDMIRLGGEDGPGGIAADSGLAPSILAESAFCGPKAQNGTEGQVVLLYARDMFLYAAPTDHEQTDRFWKAAKAEIAARRSLSSTPLTCHDGHWVAAKAP
jgi:hypothetical protein